MKYFPKTTNEDPKGCSLPSYVSHIVGVSFYIIGIGIRLSTTINK